MINFDSVASGQKASLKVVASQLGIDWRWLYILAVHESDNNPRAMGQIAFGLFQWTTNTLQGLGVTPSQVLAMSYDQQCQLQLRYLKGFSRKIRTFYQLTILNFLPKDFDKVDQLDWKIGADSLGADVVARWNPIFDLDSNGSITMGEYRNYLYNWCVSNGVDPSVISETVQAKAGSSALGLVFLLFVLWWLVRFIKHGKTKTAYN